MKKKQTEKMFYVKPECDITQLEIDAFICTSVYTNPPFTTEEDWGPEDDVDVEQVEF